MKEQQPPGKTAALYLPDPKYWEQFLTNARMNRWNHIRRRAGVAEVNRGEAITIIMALEATQRGLIWSTLK
jgi:hypothetical protein